MKCSNRNNDRKNSPSEVLIFNLQAIPFDKLHSFFSLFYILLFILILKATFFEEQMFKKPKNIKKSFSLKVV